MCHESCYTWFINRKLTVRYCCHLFYHPDVYCKVSVFVLSDWSYPLTFLRSWYVSFSVQIFSSTQTPFFDLHSLIIHHGWWIFWYMIYEILDISTLNGSSSIPGRLLPQTYIDITFLCYLRDSSYDYFTTPIHLLSFRIKVFVSQSQFCYCVMWFPFFLLLLPVFVI